MYNQIFNDRKLLVNKKLIKILKRTAIIFLAFLNVGYLIPRIFSAPNSFASELYFIAFLICMISWIVMWDRSS